MFTQSLIDDYIVPLTKTAHPNFGPLAAKILQVDRRFLWNWCYYDLCV